MRTSKITILLLLLFVSSSFISKDLNAFQFNIANALKTTQIEGNQQAGSQQDKDNSLTHLMTDITRVKNIDEPNPIILKELKETNEIKNLPSKCEETYDLVSLYNEAEMFDSILQAAKENQLAIREAIPLARAQFLAVISGQIIATANENTDPEFGSFKSEVYTLSATQPILHFDHWFKYQQAIDIVKQANATYSAAEQDLMIRTATTYFNVLLAIDNLAFAKESVAAFAKFLHETQERFKVGLIAITDVEIARAQHDNAVALEIVAANELFNQKQQLRTLTGHAIQFLLPLKETLNLVPPTPAEIEPWVATALAQNFTLQAARFGTLAAKENIKINKSQHLPTFDAIAQIQRSAPITNLPGPRVIESSVGLQVNIPIFQGGTVTSKTREAIHNYLKTDRDLETSYRNIENNTRQAFQGVLTQINQEGALKQALISNQNALDATQASFNVGTRTIVDVLTAQRNLIAAKQSYAAARYSYILQSLQLKQAAGTLCEDDLRHINCWLQH